MNIRLWELDNGDLINLERIEEISKVKDYQGVMHFYIQIYFKNARIKVEKHDTRDEAKLSRFKLVERWNACLDMIHNQEWVPEAGTFSSSSKPIKEDKFNGYRESEH